MKPRIRSSDPLSRLRQRVRGKLNPSGIILGDAFRVLRDLPTGYIDCIVTSPPYWQYGRYCDGAIGTETLDQYIYKLTKIFREARRVLKDSGNFWLNMGDCYCVRGRGAKWDGGVGGYIRGTGHFNHPSRTRSRRSVPGLRSKSKAGVPWKLCLTLMKSGWILRQDNIWYKINAMPEGVSDRTVTSHEYVFHFTKHTLYWHDINAIRVKQGDEATWEEYNDSRTTKTYRRLVHPEGRAPRSVWVLSREPSPKSLPNYSTYPRALAAKCISAGCPPGGRVLDMFVGSGVTAEVCLDLRRQFIGIDIDPVMVRYTRDRVARHEKEILDRERMCDLMYVMRTHARRLPGVEVPSEVTPCSPFVSVGGGRGSRPPRMVQ